MDQVWKGLSNLDPRDPGGFYKKTALKSYKHISYVSLYGAYLTSRTVYVTMKKLLLLLKVLIVTLAKPI